MTLYLPIHSQVHIMSRPALTCLFCLFCVFFGSSYSDILSLITSRMDPVMTAASWCNMSRSAQPRRAFLLTQLRVPIRKVVVRVWLTNGFSRDFASPNFSNFSNLAGENRIFLARPIENVAQKWLNGLNVTPCLSAQHG